VSGWVRTLLLIGVAGCGPRLGAGPDDGGSATQGNDDATHVTHVLRCFPERRHDVLLVIDDTPSMTDWQLALAQGLSDIVRELVAPDGVDVRVAFTSTDMGNPACADPVGEDAAFSATSCRARLEQFVGHDTDAREACELACRHESVVLEPTAAIAGGPVASRPWIEFGPGGTNLPAGVEAEDAAVCLGLVGVDGCPFASPLAALDRALERVADPSDPAYGFLRPGAHLAVLFISGGVECSYADPSIFSPSGDRTFWSDPNDAATPAVCWRAGVSCRGGPGTYDACEATSFDAQGNAVAEDGGVLRTVAELTDRLHRIEASKQSLMRPGPPPNVFASMVSGALTFADAEDAHDQAFFGIGPSCASSLGGRAHPPVRLAEALDPFRRGVDPADICDDVSFAEVLGRSGGGFADRIRPLCMAGCLLDVDPSTPALDPDCNVTLVRYDADTPNPIEIPACIAQGDGWAPSGSDAQGCWAPVIGDDMHQDCIDRGATLQFELHGLDDPSAYAVLEATCALDVEADGSQCMPASRDHGCPGSW
jgi:hypothetical protein